MRSFSWNCFAVTGNIDAYLLFKDAESVLYRSEEREEKSEEKIEQ
ncbi:YqzL family protein [Salinithrix halophila]|uniref:YqzL family protein n=1 Tax=Salinithrix halophila TaxID=1485204 RepID=A0ABV8JD87_9BACL